MLKVKGLAFASRVFILTKSYICVLVENNIIKPTLSHGNFIAYSSLLHAAMNYVYDVPFAARLSAYFLKSGVLKVQERREFEVLVLMHKIVHKNCPVYLFDLIKFVSDASSRSLRAHKFKLRIPL
jgi:hypothetical protein